MKNRDISRLRGGARMSVVTFGACGLLLFAGGMSWARAHDDAGADDRPLFGGGGWPDRDLGGIMNPALVCNKQAVQCIMGPVNSGN